MKTKKHAKKTSKAVKAKKQSVPVQILRYPRLDTVLMVEQAIRKHDGSLRKKALWEHLPRKTMYQTYCVIIDYLLYSRKISIDTEGKLGWIYYPEKAGKRDEHLRWRSA